MKHADYKFSITVYSDDYAFISSLRGLAYYCETSQLKNIAYSNTGRENWDRDDHRVTFHFSRPEYRDSLVSEAGRLFSPKIPWRVVGTSDDDPASPA